MQTQLNSTQLNSTENYGRRCLTDTGYYIMDRNQLFPLEKVKSIVDLGVRFDNNLTFRDHISEKVNKAYSVLGIIKRNFIYIWMNALLYYFVSQWYARMLNLQIRSGARIRYTVRKIKYKEKLKAKA